jgi:small-conductance mechanosensitive channel
MHSFLNSIKSFESTDHLLVDWFLALGMTLALFLVLRLMFSILKRRISSLSKKTATVADDLVAAALESTRNYTLFVAALWGGLQFVDLARVDTYLDFALLIFVTLQIAIWANRMVTAYIVFYSDSKVQDNPGAVSAVQGMSFIARLLIWSIALLLVIDNLGYDITTLVAGLGIGGIAVALALQNILGDLFASLSIVLDKPFVIGDFIIVGDLMGGVEKIGLKTTRVRSLSGEQLIFSNTDLLSSRVRNYKRMQERRVSFTFGVLYQSTPDQLEAIPPKLKEIIEAIDQTRFDRAHFKGFGDSSYDFEVVYYVLSADYVAYMDIQQKINLSMCRWFEQVGVEFAYPTRTVYLKQEEA